MQPLGGTTVDQVRGLLVDTILPAALAAASLTTPVFYGSPGRAGAPDVYVSVHPSGGVNRAIARVPYTEVEETYNLPVITSVRVGDVTPTGQRAATETAWAHFRAMEAALVRPRVDQPWALGIDNLTAYFSRVADNDFLDEAKGRVAVVVAFLAVTANTKPAT